jgi:hypothetical protein
MGGVVASGNVTTSRGYYVAQTELTWKQLPMAHASSSWPEWVRGVGSSEMIRLQDLANRT